VAPAQLSAVLGKSRHRSGRPDAHDHSTGMSAQGSGGQEGDRSGKTVALAGSDQRIRQCRGALTASAALQVISGTHFPGSPAPLMVRQPFPAHRAEVTE
jgi:hypothetical protein